MSNKPLFKILCIDPDERYCERLSRAFECFPKYFDFYYSNDPGKVLEGIQDGDFNLILTEIDFPEFQKYETMNYFVKLKELLPNTKVIICTANKDVDFIDSCIHTNAVNDYIRKSLTGTDLVRESFKLLLGSIPNPL